MAFNILIVDDSSSMRAVIKKIIKLSGFDVGEYLEASDGEEAIGILKDEWVDVVLTDINMPKMNGLELIKEMKKGEIFKSIPVVMVTTEGSKQKMKESLNLGAQGYIKKPFLPEDIKKTLNNIMGEPEDEKRVDDDGDEGYDF